MTGPQELSIPPERRRRVSFKNNRLSSRPPRTVYFQDSFFWTTSFFSDTYVSDNYNLRLLPQVVNGMEKRKGQSSPDRPWDKSDERSETKNRSRAYSANGCMPGLEKTNPPSS